MGHHLAWILAGQTDQRRRGVRNLDCEGWWRAIHSVSHQTISEDWSLNTSMCRQCCGFSICMLLRSRGVFFLSTIVQQEGAHRLRNNLQNCTSRLLSTRALWRAVCPCLLRRLRQMDVVYRLPKGCPWSSSRGVKSCWFVWFYWFLFQAVEVLCASPTSLQKFCPLKAGIQQHGNTFAS